MTITNSEFTTLYTQHYNALLNFAKKLTKDVVKAEDLVQETAVKAFRGMHTFKEGSNFKSWTFTILKNTFISKYYKKKRRGEINAPIEEFTFSQDSTFAVSNDAISDIRLEELNDCIAELSYKCKMPFLMYTEGYHYDEIADELNIPIGTVKSRINYARTKLKDMIIIKDRIAA